MINAQNLGEKLIHTFNFMYEVNMIIMRWGVTISDPVRIWSWRFIRDLGKLWKAEMKIGSLTSTRESGNICLTASLGAETRKRHTQRSICLYFSC